MQPFFLNITERWLQEGLHEMIDTTSIRQATFRQVSIGQASVGQV